MLCCMMELHANCLLLFWQCKNSNMSLKKPVGFSQVYFWLKILWRLNEDNYMPITGNTYGSQIYPGTWRLEEVPADLLAWLFWCQQCRWWHSGHNGIWNVKSISATQKPTSEGTNYGKACEAYTFFKYCIVWGHLCPPQNGEKWLLFFTEIHQLRPPLWMAKSQSSGHTNIIISPFPLEFVNSNSFTVLKLGNTLTLFSVCDCVWFYSDS